ncbi:hypothetical protein GCM10028804_33580 [Larkinella terrae]
MDCSEADKKVTPIIEDDLSGTQNEYTCPAGLTVYSFSLEQSATVELKQELTFDDKKQLVKEKRIYLHGTGQTSIGDVAIQANKNLIVNVDYKYDANGFLIEKVPKIENPEVLTGRFEELSYKYRYANERLVEGIYTLTVYGANGVILQNTITSPGTEYEYDSQGRLTSINQKGYGVDNFIYDAGGLSRHINSRNPREDYRYLSQNGRVIRRDSKSDTRLEAFDRYTLFGYDSDGQLTSVEEYRVNGGLFSRTEYTYDGKRRPIQTVKLGNLENMPSPYESPGLIKPEIVQFKGHLNNFSFYGVRKSNLLGYKAYSVENDVTKLINEYTYTYKYDSQGYPTQVSGGGFIYRWGYCKHTY